MIIKINAAQGRQVVAICDEDILGKKFEEGDLMLDLSSNFYKGEVVDEEETKKVMKLADHLNLVGEKTIKIALELEIIDQDNIRKIQGIPFAQATVIKD